LQRRAKVSPTVVAASGVVVAGTFIVQGAGHTSGLGIALAVGALLAEVAFTLLAVPVLPRLGATTVSTAGCGLAALQLLIAAALVHGTAAMRAPDPTEAAALAYLAVAVTAIAFVLWYTGVDRIGSDIAGLFAGLVPVGALFTAWFGGTGSLDAAEMVGTALVATAITAGPNARPGRCHVPTRSAAAGRADEEVCDGAQAQRVDGPPSDR
jgi:drug/metabolite transporter (DMT)-like permease